jgi:hypothetical protein
VVGRRIRPSIRRRRRNQTQAGHLVAGRLPSYRLSKPNQEGRNEHASSVEEPVVLLSAKSSCESRAVPGAALRPHVDMLESGEQGRDFSAAPARRVATIVSRRSFR